MGDPDSVVRISPAEAHTKLTKDGFVYVDVRTAEEFDDGHPAGAINVPWSEDFVATMAERFSKDAKIVVGCKSGVRSLKAARALIASGFASVVDQRAGWDGARGAFGELLEPGWVRAGLP